jgi:hypothetical protein
MRTRASGREGLVGAPVHHPLYVQLGRENSEAASDYRMLQRRPAIWRAQKRRAASTGRAVPAMSATT